MPRVIYNNYCARAALVRSNSLGRACGRRFRLLRSHLRQQPLLILRLSSLLGEDTLLSLAEHHSMLLLKPAAMHSEDEFALAHHLAKKSFAEKTNIAKKFKLEFLLWLAGTRDIKKAFEGYGFDDMQDVLLVSFSNKSKRTLLKMLNAKEKKLSLKKHATALELERISLSRI